MDFHASGSVAYVVLGLQQEIVTNKDGKTRKVTTRGLLFLKKEEKNDWKMIHSNWSMAYPLPLDDTMCVISGNEEAANMETTSLTTVRTRH